MNLLPPTRLGMLVAALVLLVMVPCAAEAAAAPEPPAAAAPEMTPAATRQYAAAVRLQNLKSYDLAIEEWEKFLDQFQGDPRVGEATHYLGVCYYQAGKLDEASATFEKVVRDYPQVKTLEMSYLYLGVTQSGMAQSGKPEMFDKAAETLATLVTKFPEGKYVPDATYYRADCLYRQGKKDEAVAAYTQFVENHATHRLMPVALYELGVAQQELNRHEAAGASYDAFLKQFSEHPLVTEVGMRRGEVFYAVGEFAEAAKRLAAAAAVEGFALADYATVCHADALAQLRQHAEAAALYASVLTKYPESQYLGRATLQAGKCFYLADQFAEARTLLEKSVAGGGPAVPEAGHWIAKSFLKEGQPADALAVVEKILPQAAQSEFLARLLLDQADAIYEIPERRKESVPLYAALATQHAKDPVAPEALYKAAFGAMEQGQYDPALKYAQNFLTAYPEDELVADVMLLVAESNLLSERYPEAEKGYAELLEKYPNHADAELWKVRRGLSVSLQKKPQETIDVLQPVLAEIRNPDRLAQAWHLIGISQFELKQFDAAVKSLQTAITTQPKWLQADETLLALALAYRGLNDLDQAKASASRLIAEFPDSRLLDKAHYRLGEYLYLAGDFKSAAAEYRQVLDDWPESPLVPHALHELGCAQMDLNDDAGAEGTLGTLIEKHPQHALIPRARFSRGMARHRLKQYAPAVEDLEAFLATDPAPGEKSNARYLLGLCQVELTQYDPAVATFQQLLQDDPQYAGADKTLYQMAWALKLSGKEAEGAKVFGQLAEQHKDSPHAAEGHYQVAELHYKNKEYAKAAVAYFAVMKLVDKSDLEEKAGHKLAWCYYHEGDYAKAQQTFGFQLQAYPNGPLVQDGAFMEAESFFKQDKFQEALAAYEKLPELTKKDFQVLALLHAGQAAGQLKLWDKSLELLTKCTEQFPDPPHAPQAFYEQGWAQQNLGKLDEAVTLYEKVIALTDVEVAARAQYMIGQVQFEKKLHKEAIKSFFKVMYGYSYPQWQADATFEAAQCFGVLQQKTQAIKLFQELIDKFP